MSAYDGAGFPHRTTFTSDQIQVIRHVMRNKVFRLINQIDEESYEKACNEFECGLSELEGMKI